MSARAARAHGVDLALVLALVFAVLAPAPVLAQIGLWLFGPSDWPSTLALVREKFPRVAQLSTDELARRLAADAPASTRPLLVDTRTAAEYAVSHLAGAVHAADEASLAAVLASAPSERPVVVYCSVGYRSSALAQALVDRRVAGADRLRNLEGSIFAWANEGRAIVRTVADGRDEPVSTVHPYDRRWAKLLAPERRASDEKGRRVGE